MTKYIKKLFLKNDLPIFLLIVCFSFLYLTLSITRHNNYQSFGYDLGMYDQVIWLYSRLMTPFSTIKIPNMILLADHFAPSLALLSPLYWIVSDVRLLLSFQVLIFTTSCYPIYKLSLIILKRKFISLCISFSYLAFWGMQNAIAFDFHAITIAASLLPWLFYFIHLKRWKPYFFLLIICLGLKEDVSIIIASLGVYIIITYKNFKIGISTLVIGLLWFFLITQVIIGGPHPIFGESFVYSSKIPTSPQELFNVFFSPFTSKWKTIFYSIFPFLFLPIFSLGSLIMIFTHFLVHFLDPKFSGRWEMALHYRAPLSSMLTIGTIFTLTKIKSSIWLNLLAIGIVLSTLFVQWNLHSPLNVLSKKSFYERKEWISDLESLYNKFPSNASLATQNNIIPHLSHRKQIYYFRIEDKGYFSDKIDPEEQVMSPCRRKTCWWINTFNADYLLVDLHPDQSVNNFWDKNERQAREGMESLVKTATYEIIAQKNNAFLLKKINNEEYELN